MTDNKLDLNKAGYALLGAPVWIARRFMDLTGDLTKAAREEMTEWAEGNEDLTVAWAEEGEKLASRFSDGAPDMFSNLDLSQIQESVQKVQDQVEELITNWRDAMTGDDKPTTTAVRKPATAKAPAKKPAAKKAPAKKAAAKPAAKKAPAKKAAAKKTTATRKPAAKKAPAKKAAAKPAAKKAPAKKTTAKSTAAKKPAAKKTTAKKS